MTPYHTTIPEDSSPRAGPVPVVSEAGPTPLTAALDALDRGIRVIPVPYKSKNPNRPGWQHERHDRVAILRVFNRSRMNVGALWGEPSGGIVDIDQDCPQARQAAPEFLPPTEAVYGHTGNPLSHYLFRCEEGTTPKTTKYEDTDGTMLLELRSTGTQSLLPGSTHPEGYRYTWDRSGTPTTVDGRLLLADVARLAGVALLARHWPAKGARHEAALALAGGLAHAGVPVDEAIHLVSTVAGLAGDEQAHERAQDVADTYRRANGRSTTGWPALARLLGAEVVTKLRGWWGVARPIEPAPVPEAMVSGPGDAPAPPAAQRTLKPSQATRLVELAKAAVEEWFHTPDGEPYALLARDGHLETWRLRSKAFRRFLAHLYFEQEEGVPNSGALADAVQVLEGEAQHAGAEQAVYVRVAGDAQTIYLDLADEQWRVIKATAASWEVIPSRECPMRFRRPKTALPLPVPVRGGRLQKLWDFLNVLDPADRLLLVSWLVHALCPHGPYPVLLLTGEQGSAKSTAAAVLRRLIDPRKPDHQRLPKDERDLAITANNSWVQGFDNLSRIPEEKSDVLCRLATGGGFATRELYSDDEEVVFDAQRPVVLTGIEEVVTRSDLLDRTITLRLPQIADERRQEERVFWADFEAERPRLLGVLLDGVSGALRNRPTVTLSRKPRMADFARWAAGAAESLGWTPEAFVRVYERQRAKAHQVALEGSPLVAYLRETVGGEGNTDLEGRRVWQGSATTLLSKLTDRAANRNDSAPRSEAWPKNARALSGHLTWLAPNLRATGLEVSTSRTATGRLITLELLPETEGDGVEEVQLASFASLASSTAAPQERNPTGADDANPPSMTQIPGAGGFASPLSTLGVTQ